MVEPVLWVIAGTGEAVALAHRLAAEGIPCLVTVTTAAARQSYSETPNLKVRVGGLEVATLGEFIAAQGIGAVLDVSHPFAVEISQGAIAAAQALNLPYWRYERPSLAQSPDHSLIRPVVNLEALLTPNTLAGQRVLLTLWQTAG